MNKPQESELREKIGLAVGHASMCWNPRPGDQVFDSTEASKVVDELYEYVNGLLQKQSDEFESLEEENKNLKTLLVAQDRIIAQNMGLCPP